MPLHSAHALERHAFLLKICRGPGAAWPWPDLCLPRRRQPLGMQGLINAALLLLGPLYNNNNK